MTETNPHPDTPGLIQLDWYAAAVWRGKWFVMGLVIAAVVGAGFIAYRRPVLHTGTALIEPGKVWKEPLEDPLATAEIILSPGFIDQLAGKTGDKPGRVRQSVSVDPVMAGPRRARYAVLLRITAQASTAEQAKFLAQAAADQIVSEHAKIFDQALAPHLESQHRLEQRLKELGSLPGPPDRELIRKIETELDEVTASNSSPTITERTHLVEGVASGLAQRPSILRPAVAAALLAAAAGVAAVIIAASLKAARQEAPSPILGTRDDAGS
jgi:hypothetical protein